MKKSELKELIRECIQELNEVSDKKLEKIWLDICKSNQREILVSLELYKKEIEKLINSLKHNKWRRLTSFLKNAKYLRDKII